MFPLYSSGSRCCQPIPVWYVDVSKSALISECMSYSEAVNNVRQQVSSSYLPLLHDNVRLPSGWELTR